VVGTAPTSVMVITKFVYRRSWQANSVNIKGITIVSITIMKLTKKQSDEIKNQLFISNQIKKGTALELKKVFYEPLTTLDYGFVKPADHTGDEISDKHNLKFIKFDKKKKCTL